VGYIPVYQQMIDRKNDGQFRNSEFYLPTWTCLMCKDGFGLSSDFLQCLPCPISCITCYMAQNNSCIKANITLPANNTVPPVTTGCQYYIDQKTSQCVQSCSSATSQPQLIQGVLYCVQTDSSTAQNYARIDSAIYTSPDGTKNVFFVIDQSIKSSNTVNLSVIKQGSTPKLSASGNSSSASANAQATILQSNSFVSIYDNSSNNSVYILNLTG
jgi:hypothetical protein